MPSKIEFNGLMTGGKGNQKKKRIGKKGGEVMSPFGERTKILSKVFREKHI